MTACITHQPVPDNHMDAARPVYLEPVTLDTSEAVVMLALAHTYANGRLLEDRRAAVETLRDLAIWASDMADSLEDAE